MSTDRVLELSGAVGYQVFLKTPCSSLEEFVERLEKETGLRFMARKKKGDTLHGFVTWFPDGVVVSFYGKDKKPDKVSPHYFKKAKITNKVREGLSKVGLTEKQLSDLVNFGGFSV